MELFVIFSTKVFYDRSWDVRIWNSTMMALLFNFGTLLAWNLEFSTRFSFDESLIIVVPSWKNGRYSELYLQKTRGLYLEAPKKLDWYWVLSKINWSVDWKWNGKQTFLHILECASLTWMFIQLDSRTPGWTRFWRVGFMILWPAAAGCCKIIIDIISSIIHVKKLVTY